MKIYVYKLTLTDGTDTYAVGQLAHSEDTDVVEVACSQPMEVPDTATIDEIIKHIKSCVNKTPTMN